MKQVILIRKDLNMRRGKEIAQGAHASIKAVLENFDSDEVQTWLNGIFTKIVVGVSSENELIDLYNDAKSNGLIASLILDNGITEFDGVHTYTAAAIGPGNIEDINKITGHLDLR